MKLAKRLSLIIFGAMALISIACFIWANYNRKLTPDVYPRDVNKLIEQFGDTYCPSYYLDDERLVGELLGDPKEAGLQLVEYLENAPLVVKCKPSKTPIQLFRCTEQSVNVQEVYKGDKKLVGQEITFTMSLAFNFSETMRYMPFQCVNYMKANEEYLLFLYPFAYADNNPDGIPNGNNFTTTNRGYLPYFSFSDHENKLFDKFPESQPNYGQVIDNEFFVMNEKALEMMLKFKADTIAKYTAK